MFLGLICSRAELGLYSNKDLSSFYFVAEIDEQ